MSPLTIPQAVPVSAVAEVPARSLPQELNAAHALRAHWPEYLMEAAGLGLFMFSACAFTYLLEHPGSSLRQMIAGPEVRRSLMGLAMAATALIIIYSPIGRRSGAHINPAVTLAFLRLGRVKRTDAAFYIAAQIVGSVLGVALAAAIFGALLDDPAVRYAATLPGSHGQAVAFFAEFGISLVLMSVVLASSASPQLERFTGLFAAALVATYITLEAPLSGMSMNPARSFGSNAFAGAWQGFWIYLTAPVLAMQLAVVLRLRFGKQRGCAKLRHDLDRDCIFCGHKGVK